MIVRDLIQHLMAQDQEAAVEFHDVTTDRECPVNTVTSGVRRNAPIKERVILSNRLGRSDPPAPPPGQGKSAMTRRMAELFA